MLRMKHPKHGFHHAYGTHEEEAMRKAGWVDDVPEPEVQPESEPEPASEDGAEAAPQAVAKATRRPGRPRKV